MFILNLYYLDIELYIVSLYKINKILESYNKSKPLTKEIIVKVLITY